MNLAGDPERVRAALNYVPASDRDTWLRMGMAVKHELGEDGFDLWDSWSQQADSYDATDARDVWRSLRGNGKVTAGTLFHEAKANGWRGDGTYRMPDPDEIAERRRAAAERAAEETADLACVQADAARKAATIWKTSLPADDTHPYLERKGVKAHGLRLDKGALVVPMRDADGTLHSRQSIDADGTKEYLPRGRKTGCYHAIGKAGDRICIAEGYATGASIHEATGYAVAIAFDVGNLRAVAQSIKAKYPAATLILCGDDDYRTKGNPGITKAEEAARAVGGLLAVPVFGSDRPDGATDFNDLARHCGREAVERAIANAKAPEVSEAQPDENNAIGSVEWPEPLPIVATIAAEPYPLDALPATIRSAVDEVHGFTKAPVAMVASSALAALSVAIQASVDAQRADKLRGPVGVFLLTIADSGERKSTCDGFFSAAIRDYQTEQAEAAKPALAAYRADADAWKAKRDALTDRIRANAKITKPTAQEEQELRELEANKPEPPRVPRLLRGDDTPENLAFALMHEWPSAGVLSAEAGSIFGAHGMKSDSIMFNLSLLNILWDGGSLPIGRRTSASFTMQGARLTLGLQVQEATLRAFIDKSGGLARGTGFFARCLVSWPESTQGYRPFTEAPATWPALASFNRRIAALLEQPAPISDDGTLSPTLLALAPDAKAAWIAFHDAIEGELRTGGELYDVRDIASKTADNAARLGALLQVFEYGAGAVSSDSFEAGSRIAAWHLNEARRFFGELALPPELANAARLDAWLLDYCRRERTAFVPRRKVQQFGPSGLRDKVAIDVAVRELDELGRARLVQDGRRKDIRVNPALLQGGSR